MRLNEVHVAHIVSLEYEGKTTAAAILADAKNPTSPIHELYDWDVQKAAEAHWMDRTREIVRLVKVVVHLTTHTIKLPRYLQDPDKEPGAQGYMTVDALRLEPTMARRALRAEFDRVTSSLKRARLISIGLGLEDEVDGLLATVSGLRSIIERQMELADAETERLPAAPIDSAQMSS